LNTTGCLSFIRTFTHNVYHSGLYDALGTWSDGSSGPCSGDIGNGGTVEDSYSPTQLACGLPANGIIGEDTVYTLEQDCICIDEVLVATGVSVTINANGFRIFGCEEGVSGNADTPNGFPDRRGLFRVGGFANLKFNNANIYGVRTFNYGGSLTVANSMITETSPTPIHNHGYAYVYGSTFQNNRGHSGLASSIGSVYYGTDSYRLGRALFRDNVFRGNSIGLTELVANGDGTSITLCGENLREDSAPSSPPTDDTVLPPQPPPWLGLEGGAIFSCPEGILYGHGGGSCYKQQPLGAIGLICHVDRQPPAIEILEISRQSEGRRILRVDQSQIERAGAGLVACSADGRAAVRVGLTGPVGQMMVGTRAWQDASPQRVIQVSMGPTLEDKVHHVVIDDVLDGHVLGTVDTRPDSAPCPVTTQATAAVSAPAPVVAQPVVVQQPRADGSIIHVVQAGDTVWTIGVAYDVHPHVIIERNALGMRGRFIYAGQELLIREA